MKHDTITGLSPEAEAAALDEALMRLRALSQKDLLELLTTMADRMVTQAVAEEREACAKVAEGVGAGEAPDGWGTAQEIANQIRARP